MNELRFKQICIAQWQNRNGESNYSTIGLTDDGAVYKYSVGTARWVPYIMKASTRATVGEEEPD